jgi:hypothetical protein
MNENVRKRNAVLAQTVIKGLESRNMTGYYAKDKEEALKQALDIVDLCVDHFVYNAAIAKTL